MPSNSLRRIAWVFLGIVGSMVLYFMVTLVQVWNTGRDDSFLETRRNVDAIVVLGATR